MKNYCFVVYDMSILGGAEKVASTLANKLCEYANVHIISLVQSEQKIPYTLNTNINYTCLNIDSNSRLRQIIFKSHKPLINYFKKNSIDTAFLIGNYAGICACSTSKRTKTKVVYCDHGAIMNEWNKKKIKTFRFITSKLCNKTITLTKQSMEAYIEKFHIKNIDYIYNPIDLTQFGSEKYNSNSNKIITVGRMESEKGFDMLVDIAKIVFQQNSNWQWHIYGDGKEYQNIKNKIIENNLQNNIVLKGISNNINEIYKDYALYVLSSYREGLPLVLLEAKACKLPIVSFDVTTGPSEIIQNNINGYLVPCYDINQMADKINDLINNADKRKSFSDNAYLDIEKFDMETIIQKWLDI